MGLAEKIIEGVGDRVALVAETVRDEVRAGLAQSRAGSRITGAAYLPVPARSQLLNGGPCRLAGWSVWASGGAERLILHDGRTIDGDVVAVVDLADTEHDTTWLPGGVSLGEGLYIETIGPGTAIGSIFLAVID